MRRPASPRSISFGVLGLCLLTAGILGSLASADGPPDVERPEGDVAAVPEVVVEDTAPSAVATTRPAPQPEPIVVRPMQFPVLGPVIYSDSYGDCRDGCSRYHHGIDLIGTKMQPLVSTVDGIITKIYQDEGKHGIGLAVTDADGWTYVYFHINNDTPGDVDYPTPESEAAAKRRWHMPPNVAVGSTVTAGQVIAWMGNSGNAETSTPHLHFEIRDRDGDPVNPYPSLRTAQWRDRCRTADTPDSRPAPVLSPPDVVAGTLFTFVPRWGVGSFTISAPGGVITVGDAATIGNSNFSTPDCAGAGPTLTARSLPTDDVPSEPTPDVEISHADQEAADNPSPTTTSPEPTPGSTPATTSTTRPASAAPSQKPSVTTTTAPRPTTTTEPSPVETLPPRPPRIIDTAVPPSSTTTTTTTTTTTSTDAPPTSAPSSSTSIVATTTPPTTDPVSSSSSSTASAAG